MTKHLQLLIAEFTIRALVALVMYCGYNKMTVSESNDFARKADILLEYISKEY